MQVCKALHHHEDHLLKVAEVGRCDQELCEQADNLHDCSTLEDGVVSGVCVYVC